MLQRQKERLVDLMEADLFSTNRSHATVHDEMNHKNKWNKFATELNLLGPPFQTGDEWEESADELVQSAKKKVGELRQHQNGTGGGSPSKIQVSDLDRKLIKLFGKNHFDGHQNLNELGFLNRRIEPIRALMSIQDGPSTHYFDEVNVISDESDESFEDLNADMDPSARRGVRFSNQNPKIGFSNRTSLIGVPGHASTPFLRSPSSRRISQGSGPTTSKNIKRLSAGQQKSVRSDKKSKPSNTLARRLNALRKQYPKKSPTNEKDVKSLRNKTTSYEMVQEALSQQREFMKQSNQNHGETTSVLRTLAAAVEKLGANKN